MTPQRIQRRRTKGWRMPAGAIYVGRPTKWGNPWRVRDAEDAGYDDGHKMAVYAFREWLRGAPRFDLVHFSEQRWRILHSLHELRDHDLVCWCPPDKPCHADVLLELANTPAGAK